MAVTKTTTFSESNININNNTSSLSIKIYFSANNSITWFESATLSCTCNGVTKSKSVSHPIGGSVSTTFTFSNIAHNNDGTKNVSWSWRCPTGTSVLGTITDSGTKKLTTINRKATVTSGTNFTDTTNPTLSFSNPGGFKLRPYINLYTSSSGSQIGNTIYPTNISSTGANISSPYTWDLTDTQRNQMRDWLGSRTSAYATLGVITYNGSTNLGTSSKGVTFTNNLIRPIFTNFEYADINSNTRAITNSNQDIILGYSTLQITIAGNNKAIPDTNGAVISYYLINGVQYTYADSVIVELPNWNEPTIEVTVVDTRGISTKVTKTLNIVNYTPLQKGNIELLRDGNISEETNLTYNGIMQKQLPNGDNNTLTVSYEYKKTSDETYTTGTTSITPTIDNDGNFSFDDYITGDIATGFSIDDSFNVVVTVSDVLSTIQYTTTLNSGIPAIAVKGNNLAIHGAYDESLGGTQFYGDVYVNGIEFEAYNLSYSTEEQLTGKKWIDGKPTYSITILESVTRINNSTDITLDISNIDTMIDVAVNYDTSNALVPIPFMANNASQPGLSARYVKTTNSIKFFGLATYGDAGTLRITLEYTKR